MESSSNVFFKVIFFFSPWTSTANDTFHLATISNDALVTKFDVRYAVQTLNIIAAYTFRSIRCFRIRKIFIRAQFNTVYGCSQAIGSFRFFLAFIGFVGDLFLCIDDI